MVTSQPASTAPVVLVADDEPEVNHLLRTTLPVYGIAVRTAADGREAMQMYLREHERITLVLLAVDLPYLDGLQTLVRLRRINPRVMCCFLSVGSQANEMDALLAMGADGVLSKPFRVGEVVDMVRALSPALARQK